MKIKRKIISFLLSVSLFVNVPLLGLTNVYAEDIVSMNPLFMPISSVVTAVLLGSGIIAKNSQSAIQAGQTLVNNIVNEIKTSEVQKLESDASYDSPYRVINGGQPEKPDNDNKNGQWVALGGGSLASQEIWANKDAVIDIMQKAQSLGGYSQYVNTLNSVDISEFEKESTASNIALQLANISNYAVSQFDAFIHSDYWNTVDFKPDDCLFNVTVDQSFTNTNSPSYPRLTIRCIVKNENIKYIKVLNDNLAYGKYINLSNGKAVYNWYVNQRNSTYLFINNNNGATNCMSSYIFVYDSSDVSNFRYKVLKTGSISRLDTYYLFENNSYNGGTQYAYCGYKYKSFTPFEFTQNVYNVNQTFDNNFTKWLQNQISLIGEGVIDAVRLGLTSTQANWNPTQTQIQTGTSPQNVINQYINNYQNPEYIPDDKPNTDPDPDPEPEPEPVTDTMLDDASNSLWEWALTKIKLPDGIWEKIPFSIPYDCYLLIRSVLPSNNGTRKKLLRASFNAPDNPDGITISSYYDASGADVRSNQAALTVPSRWSSNAPVINWDLHFKYTDVHGQKQTFDFVKTVDLGDYAYFAMIIYICIYVSWMGTILGFIFDSFK